ncbi:MAG: hypothetical protein IKQ96_01990 [Lachnospiraceae bacterium]|nr:hypothetical protein [Lachnospiraceae bacterium]
MKNRYLPLAVLYIVLGIAIFVSCQIVDLGNSTLAQILPGMGGALFGVGIVRLVMGIKLEKDAEYRENYEIRINDERNRYLRMKAWSWAGYVFVLIAAVATIVFAVADRKELMMLASGGLCIMLVLYWVSYMIVRKKY